ncbi:MAG: energy transducer TonB [Prolixibacteraceae bacterium]
MSDSLKNNEYLNELIRYKNNKMSNEERYLFERSLERDPFLAESFEGYLEYKISDIEKDLATIDLLAGKRKIRIPPYVYYAAASILIIVASLFLLLQFGGNEKGASTTEVAVVKDKPLVFSDSTFKSSAVESKLAQGDSIPLMVAMIKEKETPSTEPVNGSTSPAKAERAVKTGALDSQLTEQKGLAAKKSAPKPTAITAAVKELNDTFVAPEVTSPKVETELADFDLLSKKSEEKTSTEILQETESALRKGANANPEPLGGFSLFKKYVDDKLIYPVSEPDGAREVVKIQFTVSSNGQLTNFVVDKGPENMDFANEAIRLLKNGPRWAPAVKDGIPQDEVVNYRIVFKPTE